MIREDGETINKVLLSVCFIYFKKNVRSVNNIMKLYTNRELNEENASQKLESALIALRRMGQGLISYIEVMTRRIHNYMSKFTKNCP